MRNEAVTVAAEDASAAVELELGLWGNPATSDAGTVALSIVSQLETQSVLRRERSELF